MYAEDFLWSIRKNIFPWMNIRAEAYDKNDIPASGWPWKWLEAVKPRGVFQLGTRGLSLLVVFLS